MAKGLFVAPDAAKEILKDLVRQRLIVAVPGARETYQYDSKPSAAVREFARAFHLKKERE